MSEKALDPHAICHQFGLIGDYTVTASQGGSDLSIWRVEHKGSIYALRAFPAGRHEQSERELAVMRSVHSIGLPVPEIHATGIWQNSPVWLISWLPGRTLPDEMRSRPWRTWLLGFEFGRMQATLHTLQAPEILQQGAGEWITWAGSDDPILNERLQETSQQQDALLHLDYHPLNVLSDGKHITGIIDWTNARAGDPRADIARTIAILRVDSSGRPSIPLAEKILRRILEHGWRAGYEQESGKEFGDLSLFYAWAGAVMERDLTHRRSEKSLEPIRQWTREWKKRANL